MSAARKKAVPLAEIESVDLISLLTIPGNDGCYEAEIVIPEEGCFDVQIHGENSTENIDSLSAIMGPRPPDRPTSEKSQSTPPTPPLKKIPTPPVIQPLSQIVEIVENDSMERIAQEIAECKKCELWKTREKTVPGVGPSNAKLVFIGEAPGSDEDKSGIPFVGRAGRHLDKVVSAAGFDRKEVFICNILKCRPPENSNPTLQQMVCCTPFLQRQLRIIKPKLIACLGNVAIKYVIGPMTPGITKVHGQWFDSIFEIPTMAMYHPSYLIRSESRDKGSPNWQMWQDIQKLKKRYDEC